MASGERHPLLSGTVVTSVGTLVSRVLGLVRDSATAGLFGLASGGVLDALVIAFRIPNLFRALFGEGALTASYLPVFTEALQADRASGWRLFRATMKWLAVLLAGITLVVEMGIGVWAWLVRENPHALLLAGLSAALLPYLILICLAAITSATLQALGRFAAPAFAPAALNICWMIGASLIAPQVSSEPITQGYVLAACILVGGLLQSVVQWPALKREGFRLLSKSEIDQAEIRHPHPGPLPEGEGVGVQNHLRRIRLGMIPTMLALTVTQLNTLSDSLVAWVFAAPRNGPHTIAWLGNIAYPLEQGAAAAIYFGERLYQFPLGLIGIAAATVAFPLLAQHAARGDRAALADDLTLGLRMVLLAAVPSAVGLVVLAEPIARLLFEHGRFTGADSDRAAGMIAVYGAGVWAYCALPVLVRGFYAVQDRITPLRVALAAVALNLALDFTLIWFLAEKGLAAATAISAALQAVALTLLFSQRHVQLAWRKLAATAARTIVAVTVMGAASLWVLHSIPFEPGMWNAGLRVAAPMVAGAAVYGVVLALIGRAEWGDLLGRK